MHEARDAVDVRLIAAGDLATLLATWLPTVQTRVYAAVRGSGADDVVQEIMLRLFRELSSGKRYPVPFRVVLHNVTGWLVRAHLRGDEVRLVPLGEDWDVPVEPVLEAAHIQPYLGPASNHVQNGLLLKADVHKLFDAGYVTVTPDYRFRVSERVRAEYENGREYYALQGREIRRPVAEVAWPSRDALAWHGERKFLSD